MNLFNLLKNNKCIPPFQSLKGPFVVDDSIGISLLVSTAYKQKREKYLLVCQNLYKATEVFNLLCTFLGNEKVCLFPADELIRAEGIAQSKEMVANRLYVLNRIINNDVDIVVTNVSASVRYLPKKELFEEHILKFKKGETVDLIECRETIARAGYLRVNKIDSSLQFAIRGDILDVYSVNYDNPIRIEFFDNEIESIRFFDLATQSSIKEVDEITILPGYDILFSKEEKKEFNGKLSSQIAKSNGVLPSFLVESIEKEVEDLMEKLDNNVYDQTTYKYFSFLSNDIASLFDYCDDYVVVVVNENGVRQSHKLLQDESWNYLEDLYEKGRAINGLDYFNDLNRLLKSSMFPVIITKDLVEKSSDVRFGVKYVPFQASKRQDCLSIISSYLNEKYKLVLALSSKEHLNLVIEILEELGLTYKLTHDFDITSSNISLCIYSMPTGFVLEDEKVVVLTSKELFNTKNKVSHYSNRFKEATILDSYEDLEPGDYVVHEYQCIGQFIALETVVTEGIPKDYLKIAYYGGENLFVPLAQFQLVRKYVGKEGYVPRLSHLHTGDWEKTKRKIKERINDLATRLMNLYIERNKDEGFAFQKDDEFQQQFEDSFPYQLTFDQAKSLDEIKRDMESNRPMDRLLCGDVGFGKTEIAFRAAFKAMLSGKQVAILCPTTLLARQHYELAKERFGTFEVNVGLLSRLVNEKEQQKYIEQAASGKLNLLIGTHRLLSKDVCFQDLGLLIIDEEQRFGVEQKERIKELKTNIDVLTLSATPIPRTLQISLLGVRQLSQINTPPNERMPIQTYVTPFDYDVVKELIERELGRGGQVFFMHNQVQDIYLFASKLQKLIPSASIAVAHGQMNKNDIEDVMEKFYDGDIDVLVCTSIVENGIDVPNANMIIVQDSERYGLAQLYQIKGRVGRSNRIAYAYLMYPEHKKMNDKLRKRLKTLQEFTELGSGYKIAQRDLMIRGAGDILGPEQAGFVDNIGLDMYFKLLNESVQEKLNQNVEQEEINEVNNLKVEAFIPDSYANESDKIALYQEINSCVTMEQLETTKEKMIDIYGKPPKQVEMLYEKRSVDILLKDANCESLKEYPSYLELVLGEDFSKIRGVGNMLFEALLPFIDFVKISYKNKKFDIIITKKKNWFNDLIKMLNAILRVYKTDGIKGDKL